MKIWMDGALVDKADAKVSVFDHGLLYGDGVFEGIRFYNGRVFRLDEHIKRLYESAKAILLEIVQTPEEMIEATLETIRANGLTDGYIRLVVTRGVGDLGINPFLCETSSTVIIASAIKLYPQEHYENGLKLITCATRRPTHGALSPQVKSLNYLNNVMAKVEAIRAGALEGLVLNETGVVAECTGDNIFIIKNGEVFSPPISDGALDGITRQAVIDLCKQEGIPYRDRSLTRHDIFTADECLLTGTAAEVIPVIDLDGRQIGGGTPGPVTQTLLAAFRKLVNTTGTAF